MPAGKYLIHVGDIFWVPCCGWHNFVNSIHNKTH
jgi:hypothetical protein